MKKSHQLGALCACLFIFVSTSINAALVSRLGGLAVYDTDLGITWLADANLAASNDFGTSLPSAMSIPETQTWFTAMNAANYLGFNDWRLPTTLDPDPSCNVSGSGSFRDCTGSEMGHLFYNELSGTFNQSILTSGDPGLALFSNITAAYWSGTPTVSEPNSNWAFAFSTVFGLEAGGQLGNTNGHPASPPLNVWAVRTGDVPVPAAVWLFGSGLLGLIGLARKKAA